MRIPVKVYEKLADMPSLDYIHVSLNVLKGSWVEYDGYMYTRKER